MRTIPAVTLAFLLSLIAVASAQNTAPVLAPIGAQSVNEGNQLEFVVSAIDSDGDSVFYNVLNIPLNAAFHDSGNGHGLFTFNPDYSQAGEFNVTFIVNDTTNLADTELVAITVNNVNRNPVLAAIGPQSVNENQQLQFVITSADPDGGALTLTAQSLPTNATFADSGNGHGLFTFNPDYTQSGSYNVRFIVSDGSLTDSELVAITVNNVNRNPVLATVGPHGVNEGSQLQFVITSTDPDGGALTLTAQSLPTNATFADSGNGHGLFTFNPDYTQSGSYNVRFIVSDGTLADSELVAITVNNVNRNPVLAAIGPRSVNENQQLQFVITSADPDGGALTLTAQSLPTNTTFADSGNGHGLFTFNPDYTQSGSYNVRFIVSDGSLTDSELVAITVNNVNRNPVLATVGPHSVDENQQLQFVITSTDPDGGALTLIAQSLPTNATFADSGNGLGLFTFNPDYTQSGSYNVRFIVSDGSLADSELVTVTVINTNRIAVLDSIPTPNFMNEGDTLRIGISASDPDGPPSINALVLPMNASLIDSGNGHALFIFTPNYYQAGVHTITIYASDNESADSQQVVINVANVNLAPVLAYIAPQTIHEGDTLRLAIRATDIDDDPAILTASNLPPNASFVDSANGAGLFQYIPGYFDTGIYTVTFIASDSVLSDTLTVNITVLNRNRAPVWETIPPRSVIEGTILAFTVAASDPDSIIPILSAGNLPINATFADSGNGHGYFRFAPDFNQGGTYDIRFMASDGSIVDTDIVRITVFEAGNQRPIIDPIGPRVVNEGQNLNFAVTAHDLDMTIPLLTTSTLPSNASFVSHGDGTGTFNFSPSFTQAGIYTILFIATDGQLADTEAVQVTVIDIGRFPVLAAIGSLSVVEGESLHVNLSATDPDNDSLYFSAVNLPANATIINSSRTAGVLSFHPNYVQSGVYFATVFVSDGVYRDSEIVQITVIEAGNRPPTFTTVDSSYTIFEGDSLGLIISAQDPDNDSLTIECDILPFNANFMQLNRTSALLWFKPAHGQAGIHTFVVNASDLAHSITKNFYITVVATGNRPPVFTAITPRSVTEGDSLIFAVSATDPDGSTPPILSAANLQPRMTFVYNGNGTGTYAYHPNFLDSGVDTIIFIATDELGLSSSLSVQITTNDYNIAPTIRYVGDSVVYEGATLHATIYAYDSTNSINAPLYLSTVRLPQNATFTDNRDHTGSFVFTPTYSQTGTDSAIFRVLDTGTPPLEKLLTKRFTIVNRNRPPSLTALGSYEMDQAETLYVPISAVDPDGDSVFLSLWNYPRPPKHCAVVDSGNGHGLLIFAPDYTQSGIFQINIRATDNKDSEIKGALIFVNDLGNQKPTLLPIVNQSVVEGDTIAFNIISSDPDSTIDSLYIEGAPRRATLSIHGDGTATFNFIPLFNQSGTYPLLIIVLDNGGLADTQQVLLQVVEAGNQPPVLAHITDRTVNENATITINVSAVDPDSTIPILSVLNLPANATFTDSADGHGLFRFSPSYYQAGSYNIQFMALDAENPAVLDSQTVNIVVNNVNQLPTIDSIGPFTIMEGDTLRFLVRGSDPDSIAPKLAQITILTNSSFVDSGNGVGSFVFHPDFNQSGIKIVSFRAMDRQDTTVYRQRSVQIMVYDYNRAPVLDSITADTTIHDGTTLRYTIHALDADNVTPRFSARSLPANATLVDNHNGTANFAFSPVFSQVGQFSITILAIDGANTAMADSQIIHITVVSSGLHPPVFSNTQTSYSVIPESTIVILLQASDPDGQHVNISSRNAIPSGAIFVDSGNGRATFRWAPDTSQGGTYSLSFLAADSTNLSDTLNISLSVINFVRGDVNGDGLLRGADVIYLVAFLKGNAPAPSPLLRADANGDGIVGGGDVTYLVRYFKGIGPPPPILIINPDKRIEKGSNGVSN
jgi:PKD repeat protein